MKNKNLRVSLFATVTLSLLLLAGCQSMVSVRHLRPAEVDLGSCRSLAVASTTVNNWNSYSPNSIHFDDFGFWLGSGFQSSSAQNAAQYASSMLVDALGATNFFTVLPPSNTDSYLNLGMDGYSMLQQKGFTGVVNSTISYFNLDEHLYTEDVSEYRTNPKTAKSEKVIVGKKYYISQTVTLTLTYTVKDLQSGTLLATQSHTGKRSRDTLVGKRTYSGTAAYYNDERMYTYTYAPSVNDMIQAILASFKPTIAKHLSPTWSVEDIALMSNKPKLEAVANAYKLADEGSLQAAYQIFLSAWNSYNHVPSGYNAALMLEALGDLDGAVSLMNSVASLSNNGDAYQALARMQKAQSDTEAAKNQINRTTSSGEAQVTSTQIVTGF